MRPPPRRLALIIGWAAVAALVLLALAVPRWSGPDSAVPSRTATRTPTPTAPPTTAQIYAMLAPSVVTIESLGAGEPAKVRGSGTGVIASAEGAILTALHVIDGADGIRVTFADGTVSPAAVAAADPANDIAILTVTTLPTVVVPTVLGNPGRLAIGDPVLAIGNPLGLTSSATAGVVSGLNRGTTGTGGVDLSGLIQFDAAVNPGSSGGPLVNGRGETVGVVVALVNPTEAGTFIGIGFAVPIGTAVAAGDGPAPQQ